MRSLIAFTKKEYLAQLRTGKLTVLGIIFLLLGIMNPAIAKMTPWLMEMMADALAQSGITVTQVTVTAMDSWVQFFKNIPMGLIAFAILEGGVLTSEYRAETLLLSLTKGLERYKVILAKATVILSIWTAGYLVCFLITYGYNELYWDNSVVAELWAPVFNWWLFGVYVIAVMMLLSALVDSNGAVLLGTAVAVLIPYFIGMIPYAADYMPTALLSSSGLLVGAENGGDYVGSAVITALTAVGCLALSIPCFNKKQL